MDTQLMESQPVAKHDWDGFRLKQDKPNRELAYWQQIIDANAEPVTVLDDQRRVVLVNAAAREWFGLNAERPGVGQKLGNALGCLFANQALHGCGTGRHCLQCGARSALLCNDKSCPAKIFNYSSVHEDQRDYRLEVRTVEIAINRCRHHMCTFHVPRQENQVEINQRMFLFRIFSTASALLSTSQMLIEGEQEARCSADEDHELKQILHEGSEQLVEEIREQRILLESKSNHIETHAELISMRDLFRGLKIVGPEQFECSLPSEVEDIEFNSDPVLLHRVLHKLLRQATLLGKGEPIKLNVHTQDDKLVILIHHPGVLPTRWKNMLGEMLKNPESELLSTHNVKLIVENILRGHYEFMSREPMGSFFILTLPMQLEPCAAAA
jgi:hypothetical protein